MSTILRTGPRQFVIRQNKKRLTIRGFGGGGGDGLPPTTGNDGYALIELAGVGAWRPILEEYIVPTWAIDSFAAVAAVLEVGATAATPAFTASYNRLPLNSAILKDDEGSADKDVTSTPTAFSSDETYAKTANNDSVQFTLEAKENAADTPVTRNTTIAWQPRTYWGVGPDGLSSEADIEGLANSALDNNRQRTFTVTAGATEHIYYAYPASYGAATFFVGGFEGGFVLVSDSISVTNAFGVTQNYRLYKSINANLGTTTVEVQ